MQKIIRSLLNHNQASEIFDRHVIVPYPIRMPLPADICTDLYLLQLTESLGLQGNSAYFISGREERKAPTPARLTLSPVRKWIKSDPRFEGGVRLHHAQANKLWEQGSNIILTTGTASGKSLVYMLEALNIVMSDPNARVVAIYPTQALNADQKMKWHEAVRYAGLPTSTIGIIDGTVLTPERPGIMAASRIIVTTPDSLDGWIMGNLDLKQNRDFIKGLRLKIVDEAHLYDGALGSNIMYTFRRLEMAQRMLNPDFTPKKHNRYMAASATMHDPLPFMKKLTGQDFVEVGEEFNGAQTHPKLIVAAPYGSSINMTSRILERAPDKQFLVFTDKRAEVEDLASAFPQSVVPYKSGMSAEFRQHAERLIRQRRRPGVVATSALEVGVDLPFDIVVNEGLPRNTGRALQRIGRAGRQGPGLFVFTNTGHDLDEYGGEIAKYLQMPVEPQVLYPNNEYIQLAHALRYLRERRQIKEAVRDLSPVTGIVWPKGFKEAVDMAQKDPTELPWNLRTVFPPRGTTPHRYNGIRSIGGTAWRLGEWQKLTKRYSDLGSTNTINAFHEYPPGAIVRHQGKRWRVQRWTRDRYGMMIDMRPARGSEAHAGTKHPHVSYGHADGASDNALLGTQVRAQPARLNDGIGNVFVGEVKFRVQLGLSHFLENYRNKDGEFRTKRVNYHEDEELARLKTEELGHDFHDYGPRRRLMINTTGVIIHIPHSPFGKKKKRAVAEAIIHEYCEAYNFSRSDIGYQESNTRFVSPDGLVRDSGNLVIYDRTAGSLRLTQFLVKRLPQLVDRAITRRQGKLDQEIEKHAKAGGTEDTKPTDETLENLIWLKKRLETTSLMSKDRFISAIPVRATPEDAMPAQLPEGYMPVIPPGTKVDWLRGGVAQRIKVLEPKLYEGALCYEVFAVDRFAFFGRARARHFDHKEAEGFVSEEKPFFLQNIEQRPLEATRLIPASELVMTSGKYIGFNPQTGHYLKSDSTGMVEDISAAMEDRVMLMRQKQLELKRSAKTAPALG